MKYIEEFCYPTFRRNMSPPSSGSKNKPSKKPASEQVASRTLTLVSYSAYSSTLEMEATCFSETSAHFQRATRRYIPEDRTLHNHRCKNLRSYGVRRDYGEYETIKRALEQEERDNIERLWSKDNFFIPTWNLMGWGGKR
jgi:hypothetical protein